jgi:TetR/AcrR family transcriptional regulator, transcriptional repressor for nem operon
MSVGLRRFPEYDLELGVFSNTVTAGETIKFLYGLDKGKNELLILSESADLSEIDVAHLPAMKRAVTPVESERHDSGTKSTAFVNLCKSNELFIRFWVHYASAGNVFARKRARFSTVEAASRHTLRAAAAEVVEADAIGKVSRPEWAENRRRILKVASRLFRERGFEAVTESGIMEAAGEVDGGVGDYFESKDDLIFHALIDALADFGPPVSDLADYASWYLSWAHKVDRAGGCPSAALGTECVRRSPEVRAAMTAGLSWQIDRLSRSAPGGDTTARRRAAIRSWSAMVGALVLARISDDEGLAQEILGEARAWIAGQGGPSGGSAAAG